MGIETVKNELPLTKKFLENILKREVADFEIKDGSNPGDNFTSILFSLEIRLIGENEPIFLLFKTFPHHPTRQKILCDTNLFLKEYLMYESWIPELTNFQKDLVATEKILRPSVPKLIAGDAIDYSGDEVDWNLDPILSNFILMVDERKTNGFQMANKLHSLGYHHVKVVLDELAKLHCLSHAYKAHNGLANIRSLFPFMEDPFFCNEAQRPTITTMLQMNLQVVKDTVQRFLEERPEIAESLRRFDPPDAGTDLLHLFLDPDGMDETEVEELQRSKGYSGAPLEDQWIVAGHGDFWTNNFLFRKDDNGKVTDAILVDLQMGRECCIMADLAYFFYSSTDTEFREKYLMEMLEWYHGRFSDYCKTLKVEPFAGFTLQNFKRKFHRSKILGFVFAVLVTPIILIKPETSVDLDTLTVDGDAGENEENEFTALLRQNNRDEDDKNLLRERFTSLLTELYDDGIL